MPFKVVNRQVLSKDIKRVDILAPLIARKYLLGQLVILSVFPHDDKIVLPLVENDANKGTIAVIFQENDNATRQLGGLQIDDEVHAVSGPFGNAVEIKKEGFVACVADGVAIAEILPFVRSFKQAGNKVLSFIGAFSRHSLILQSQMRLASYKIFMSTQDGSAEKRGRPVDSFREMLKKEKIDLVYTAGSAELMQGIADLTREKGIKTLARLNPVIFDGTGVCGSCRVTVGGKVKFACTDGPVFDAHQVDFDDYKVRLNAYDPASLALLGKSSGINSPEQLTPLSFRKLWVH